jgi:hypothetical protein
MMLVREGKLTVDQAMDKVLKVEEEISHLEKKVCGKVYLFIYSQ